MTPVNYSHPQAQRHMNRHAERWGENFRSLLRLCELTREEELPNIWHTVDPLSSERSQEVMKEACRVIAKDLRSRAHKIFQSITVMVLALVFHSEDPNGVGDAINVFLFPELSPSTGSEEALLTRQWDAVFGRGHSNNLPTSTSS